MLGIAGQPCSSMLFCSPSTIPNLLRSQARPTWFNVELAKKHPRCLEYIVVHEMTHLLEQGHGERFTKLMDEFLPDWRSRRDELNGAPLAHEEWPEALRSQCPISALMAVAQDPAQLTVAPESISVRR